MTGQAHPMRKDATPIADAGLDDFELGLLAVLRHFIISFAAPESQSWTIALRIASERWGLGQGAKAAVSILQVVEAMRRARRSVFNFSDPNCPTCRAVLCPNERHLMQMVHSVRRGEVSLARTAAMLLCEGEEAGDLLQAAWVLAGLFPADQTGHAVRQSEPFDAASQRVH